MSALRMIRQNMALIVIVIAIALLGFILTDLFTGLSRIIGGPPSVGTVAGKSITYNAFEDRVQDWIGNNPVNGEVERNQFRDRAWTDIVSEILYEKEFDEIGLSVSDDELFDMFTGENQAPLVAQNFPGMTPDQIQQQLSLLVNDPNARPQLKAFETYLARTRGQEKLANMVKSSYVGSQEGAMRKYREQNRKIGLSFLAVNYTQIPDSTVEVSDAEINSYISSHAKQYQQDEETYIRYAVFAVNPSAADTAATISRLMEKALKFQQTSTDSNYTSNQSSLPYTSPNYQAINDLPISVQDSVLGKADKALIGPVEEAGFFKLYKIVGSEEAETPAFKIKSIQIRPSGSDDAAKAEARSKAQGVASAARSGDFETVMAENAGSNLGWYRPTQFGADFDEAIKNASKGQIIGPIESNNSFHIVYIEDRSTKTYDLAQIERVIRASDATKKKMYQEANQFAGLVQSKGDINAAGAEANVAVLESNGLSTNSNSIAGINGGRDIVLWALYADVGAQSEEVFSVANNYVYAQVNSRKNEGLQSIDDVRDIVTPIVRNEKKAEIIINKLQAIGENQDLNAIKDAYGIGAYVNTLADVAFDQAGANNTLTGDPYVLGRAMGMNQGEISGPVEGKNGVYILQVTSVTEAGEADPTILSTLRQNENATGSSRLQFGVQSLLEEAGGVEDTRAAAYAKLKSYR